MKNDFLKEAIKLEGLSTLFFQWKRKKSIIRKWSAFAEKTATKSSQLQWIANTIVVGQPIWATIRGITDKGDNEDTIEMQQYMKASLRQPTRKEIK
ncbi:hypothetical protein RDI58_024430 [Solanum bulbocastanum]|uniref:Uncharacterized protein n=1 Tax=Solanum bulbocastanum TaxID=147425 RepID=A0AAN8T1V5_SOLBU